MNNADKALLNAIANRRRRYVLAVLTAAGRAMSENELATAVASAETEKPVTEVSSEERRRVLTDLHHAHLPKLERDCLVERDERGVASALDPSSLENETVARRLDSPGATSESEKKVFAALAHERRQTVVSVLRESRRSMALEDLATEVVARERETTASEVSDDEIDALLATLHHCDLPKLADAGLLEYDAGNRSVRGYSAESSQEEGESRFVEIAIRNGSRTEQFSKH